MTDTPRTQAELLSIFADQQDHGITAQDMRDFTVSLSTAGTVVIVTGQPVPTGPTEFTSMTPTGYGKYGYDMLGGPFDIPDTLGLWDGVSDHLNLTRPGWWLVGGRVTWNPSAVGIREMFLSVANFQYDPVAIRIDAASSSWTEASGTGFVYVGATDQVSLLVNQTSGGDLDIAFAYLSAHWMGLAA